jgi:hypothetical protein
MPEHSDSIESWTETMTARERIRAVAETLRDPRSTSWISEQADAAWSITSDELARLVDEGRLRRVETWEELEQSLADADLSSEQSRERRDVITRWRENETDRRLLEHALMLYSDINRAGERMQDATDHATG